MKCNLFFLFFFIMSPIIAQDPQEEIKGVINQLFKGMQEADSIAVAAVFMEEAIMQTIITNKENQASVRQEAVSNFASLVGKQKKGALNEIIEYGDIKIDSPLAFVWTPYRFYYNGTFSHSGVNAFCLVKSSRGWKIQYIIDTRKR